VKISANGQTSGGRKLVLLAASTDLVPAHFQQRRVDAARHGYLLHAAQRLRGAVYLSDGAITQTDLAPDGRYISRMDQNCWHFLVLNETGEVRGTIRYRPNAPALRFEELGISQSALARDGEWGLRLRRAVESEMALARQRGIQYVEVGGWAMGQEMRCSSESLRLALTSYALALTSGGALGIVNATQRHGSSQILRKMGGTPLQWQDRELPPYYDPRYRCQMEILRFDSDHLQPRIAEHVRTLADALPGIEVIAARSAVETSLSNLYGALQESEPAAPPAKQRAAYAG